MRESDYINATNLTKIRIARNIIRDTLPHGPYTDEVRIDLVISLDEMEEALSAEIETEARQ